MVYDAAKCGSGGNESPELSWQNAPATTKSFAIVMYDETANFVHWGMYNIPPIATSLPASFGVPNAGYPQIANDFGDFNYAARARRRGWDTNTSSPSTPPSYRSIAPMKRTSE